MPLPSLYLSGDKPREWSIARAATYGAALGAVAGLIKTFVLSHQAIATSGPEIAGAALGFALLCAGVAALRNFIARRLIWPELS
jgi:peptidoglycan/LPS O-acetylase OafA/YrhL